MNMNIFSEESHATKEREGEQTAIVYVARLQDIVSGHERILTIRS